MFSFQSCSSVPVKGGRLLAGEAWGGGVGGLVEVDGRIVWGGDDGAYILDENCKQWERLADSSETKATLAVCGGCLVYVGGLTNGLCSNKVMVWKEGKWTFMTEMLEGCWRSSVVTCSAGEGSLVVMGGVDNEGRTSVVQVFDVKTKIWHKGQPLPLACWALSAVVHENQVFVMGGHAMDHAVWSANIAELSTAYPYDKQSSVWRKLPDVPYYYSSACVVDGVLLAIGGTEDKNGEKKISAIYAYHHVEQKWQHVGDMPFECCFGDTLLQSGRRLLMVDGYSQKMLQITVEAGLAMLIAMPCPNEADERSSVVTCGDGGECGLVVMGGIVREGRTDAVQVFNGKTKTWHKGAPLPLPCWSMSAVVHKDEVFVMGGRGIMDHAVWRANITDLATACPDDKQSSVWRKLPDVPYYYSSACVVDDMLLAIGGTEDKKGENKISAIYAYDHVKQKWQQVGNMPFKGSFVDTLLLPGREFIVVDGDSKQVFKIIAKDTLRPSRPIERRRSSWFLNTICTSMHIEKIAALLPKWKEVAMQLGLESQLIADIEGQYCDPKEQRFDALTQWRRNEGSQATYQKIYDVLCHLEENEAAEKVVELSKEYLDHKVSSILADYKDVSFPGFKIGKLIFYGTPRAGKTTLRKQILRNTDDILEKCDITESSTPIAEVCSPILIERIMAQSKENNEWKWAVKELNDIASMLLHSLDVELSKQNIILHENPPLDSKSGNIVVMPPSSEHHDEQKLQQGATSTTATNRMSKSDAASIQTVMVEAIQVDSSAAREPHKQSSSKLDIKKLFLDAVGSGEWSKVVSALHTLNNSMFLQVIEGGGQPTFQEIFPLLISGPSVAVLIFKLTDSLTEQIAVQFQQNDGIMQTWPDSYTVKDFIFHAISSVYSYLDDSNPFGSKIIFVGTHKDELKGSEDKKKAAIRNTAETIHGWLRESKPYKFMQVESIEDLMIGIHSFQKQDVLKVKEKIEKFVSQTAPQDIPASLLVFDFVLQSYAKSNKLRRVEKIKCQEIANKCGINDDKFEDNLRYLHDKAGTLLYYSDIPKLNNYVITDFQLIFDSITKIIIEVNSLDYSESLRSKGQLKDSLLKDVEGCLKKDELLILLQHRHIISKIDENVYFMPSVLPKAALSYCSKSCCILVIFEHGYCPMGLFCAATAGLIVEHKWNVIKSKKQFRNRISFYYQVSGFSQKIIFSSCSTHYEVRLVKPEAGSNVKLAIFMTIKEVFTKVSTDMHYAPPSYGFYCPKTCKYEGVIHLANEHPAKCAFDDKSQEMICYYTSKPTKLTDEHKSWFYKVQQKDIINDPLDAPIRLVDMDKVAGSLPQHLIVAALLEIPQEVINDIENDYHVRSDQREAVLRRWVNKKGKAATYKVLYDALIKVDEKGAAERILEICRTSREVLN